jgi:type I restriction enzyme S subunit
MKQSWELKKLGEIILENKKSTLKSKGNEVGEYPFFISGMKVKTYNKSIIDGQNIYLPTGGNFYVHFYEGKASYSTDTWSLRTNKDTDIKYFYFFLLLIRDFINEKHFKGATIKHLQKNDFREIEIPLPPLPEQKHIVAILDEAFTAINKAKANAEQNLKNAKELFESYLKEVFENGKWEIKKIDEICNEIFAGGDAPKKNFSLEPDEKHKIAIYANSTKNRGLYGYTDFARVSKPCITIAARGSGTGHTELRNEPFLPIVRLIVCIPDTKIISTQFLKYTIDNLVIERSGSAIPQLTVPMIENYKIPIPSIEEQKKIIQKSEILRAHKENLENIYQKKIADLEELKKSVLQKAFSGDLS